MISVIIIFRYFKIKLSIYNHINNTTLTSLYIYLSIFFSLSFHAIYRFFYYFDSSLLATIFALSPFDIGIYIYDIIVLSYLSLYLNATSYNSASYILLSHSLLHIQKAIAVLMPNLITNGTLRIASSSVYRKLQMPVKKQLYTAKSVKRPNITNMRAYANYLLTIIRSSLLVEFHLYFSPEAHHRNCLKSLLRFNSRSRSPLESRMSSGSKRAIYLILLTFIL